MLKMRKHCNFCTQCKTDIGSFNLEFCVCHHVECTRYNSCHHYLHVLSWDLSAKKSSCLMITGTTTYPHTSQNGGFWEIQALTILFFLSQFLYNLVLFSHFSNANPLEMSSYIHCYRNEYSVKQCIPNCNMQLIKNSLYMFVTSDG